MPRGKERPKNGLKLEVTVIPAKYMDFTMAEIIRQLGTGPLLWAGGAGHAQAIKLVPCELKKKRGRKPKPKEQPGAVTKPASNVVAQSSGLRPPA